MARTDYTPDATAAKLYARYKRIREQEAALKAEVRDQAAADLRAGATVRELADLSGLTAEYFRRIAREEGVERLRQPTVGSLKPSADN